MKKKLLSCVLLLVLFFCLSHALADLNGQKTFGLFSYTLKGNGTATITDFDWEKNGTEDIYIPSMIDGYVVNTIGDEAFADDYFNGEAFNYYSYGAKREKDPIRIYLPDSITKIGDKAFWGSNIKMINIPANVVSIGEGAFGCCFNLDNINVATNSAYFATIDNALYNKIDKELIFWPISYIDSSKHVSINIPNGIRSIGKYVFYVPGEAHESFGYFGWPSATLYLSLPSTLTNIDDYAFFGARIQKFEYSGASTLSIGNYSFAYSEWNPESKMQDYETSFPQLTSCGEYCFAFADADRWSFIFDDIFAIAPHMFEETRGGIKSFIKIIGTPNTIAESAFCKCEAPLNIDISQCRSIAENAFAYSSYSGKYANGDFTINTETISKNTFKGANSRSITLGNQVKQIESGAFANCVINEYTIPASVRKIARDAFDIKDDVLFVESGSYAETWAIENGITYKYTGGDSLDWLN